MVLDKLGSNLKSVLNKISKSNKVDRELIEEVVKEIQKALIGADVNVRIVLELSQKIKKRALKEEISGINKQEHLISLIYDELSKFLGDEKDFEIKEGQNKIMLVGLYGQGKTTTCSKLALYFKNRGKKVGLISLDVWRPAALEQLKQLGESLNIDVYGESQEDNPIKIYEKHENSLEKYDIVLVDSAGRDSLTQELVEEIELINSKIQPTDTFLVIGSDIGQNAKKQAEAFKETLNITGIIISKMDGSGKGGGALSACTQVNAPVRFIGVGENPQDLERFNSKNFVSQLLGMGDIQTLMEKIQLNVDQEKSKDIGYKIMKGTFDLDDLYEQLKSMKKMGSMSKMMKLIPGMSQLNIDNNALKVQEVKLEKWKYAMDSMTPEEKKNPQLIEISRIKRIANGSGVEISDIRELMKQFKQTKKMMKMFTNTDMNMDKMDMKSMMKMAKKKGFKF